MPPRRLKKKYVKSLVEKRVAKAIKEYEKTRANLDNAGSSGGNSENAKGTMNKKVEMYIRGFPERIKGNITSSKPTTLHEAINMDRELVEQAVQGKAARGRGYSGNLPWCNRCKAHHQPGLCPPRCSKYHKIGHEEEDCQTRIPVARGNSLQNVTCFGCREKGYYRDKCPRGRNQQNEGARGGAYVMRTRSPSKIRT
uniref:Reverse transcriptase domain-containing protein n=1 Tax=Tanacetum cinerariifolium TaxID=118510 RepID=A0A6L2L292_TANCI|nr:reverse transcriptase domain-containing protein [Tanacetum cinerariifolium]